MKAMQDRKLNVSDIPADVMRQARQQFDNDPRIQQMYCE